MSITTGPSRSPTPEEKPAQIARALAWLTAEQNAAEAPSYTSMLLHEAATVLESGGEDEQAVRQHRAALSFEPDCRESLEHLISLAERHRQFDDLGTLYQQLASSADSVDERARSVLERAFFLAAHEKDDAGALALLGEIVEDSPQNSAAWLLYDLLADRLGDESAREKALMARLDYILHPHYRGLLLLEWSELRERALDTERCLLLLDQIVSEASCATYPALLRKERVALSARRSAIYVKSLEQRIRLVERAMVDRAAGDALGVPAHHRNDVTLGCLQALASLVQMQLGDSEAASALLLDAQAHLPSDRLPTYLAFVQAERFENWERFTALGESLARSETGNVAAWLWLHLSITRWQLGDASGARQSLTHGLEVAPRSLALRAFDVHLAIQKDDGLHLASALEATTECFESETTKAEWLLAAAGVWALLARDPSGAKAAVSQATLFGLSQSAAQQAYRLLATWAGEFGWYVDATRYASHNATSAVERTDLLLEVLRVRLMQREPARALDAIAELAATEDSQILGNLFAATLGNCLRQQLDTDVLRPTDTRSKPEAAPTRPATIDWVRLAEQAPSPELRNALHLGAVVDRVRSNELEQAASLLDSLRQHDPSDIMLAAARVVIAQRMGRANDAACILLHTAESQGDSELRATLALEGALLGIRAGATEHVGALLDLAAATQPEAVQALSSWTLRLVSDLDPALAARVSRASLNTGSSTRRALERLGLSLSSDDWPDPAVALDGESRPGHSDALELSALLARAIGPSTEPLPDTAPASLSAARAALDYLEGLTNHEADTPPSPEEVLAMVRCWANADGSLVAQLEWLLTCQRASAAGEEADALERVASLLAAKDAEPLRVSAQLRRFLNHASDLQLMPSTSAAARLANLEIALPGCDPRRRATAIEEAGELLGASATAPLRACLALNQLAVGEHAKARNALAELVETHPRFIPGWLGLRLLAELTHDDALLAQASAALGDLFSEPAEAAAEWERAATLLLDHLSDETRGLVALRKAVELDVTRDKAFSRLFRITRDAHDADSLLALIAVRLPHAKSQDELLMLHWERARTMRSVGDRGGALMALDAVSAIDPNHVGALALAGEINIALERYDDAARFLAQLARQSDAPVKQRLMGGIAAADLFDKKLNRPTFAKDILLQLHREGHSTEALRERLSALAIRVNAHPLAAEILELLMEERATTSGRADAARLAVVLHRDHMLEPALAARAVERLLREIPGDPEAIDLVLTGCFDRSLARQWLLDAEDHLRGDLIDQPIDTTGLARLAKIAQYFDDVRTRQLCLGALMALGQGTAELDRELTQLDCHVASVPTMAIDDTTLQELCEPSDCGPVAILFQTFAEVFAEALGPTLQVLGVTKKQRVDPRAGLPVRNEIVAWAGAFGIKDFDLYLADKAVGDVIAVPTERPGIVVASTLNAPLDARGRQAVARELFLLRRGTCLLRHRSATEVLALVLAACQVGGNPLAAPPYAMLDEFVRALSSCLPRRLKKTLAEQTEAVRTRYQTDGAVREWVQAAITSQDRAAALAAGDVSHVLSHLTGQRGRPPDTHELRERMARLLSFALSSQYLVLKDKLGLSVR